MRIYDEYESMPKTPENAENLFLLYRRLEKAAKHAQAMYPAHSEYVAISNCLWDDKFEKLGMGIGHYSDRLEFSMKLMAEAHRLNPHTQYRSYTLYTEVIGTNEVPNAYKAKLYLNEFPQGPYARDAYKLLADFYHDLYAALRSMEAEPIRERRDMIFFCYEDYIAKHPKDAKLERARKQAIYYFGKVLAAAPPEDPLRPMYADELDTLRKRDTDNSYHFCDD